MQSIVLIIDSLVNAGAETTNIRLAKMFKDDGFIVHLISLKHKIEIDIPKDIVFHTISYKKDKRFFRNNFFAKKLKDILNSIENKRLILGSLGLSHELMNLIDKQFNFYYVLHGNTSEAKVNKKKGIRKLLKKIEIKKLYSNKNLIAVSKAVEEDILTFKLNPKSIQTIYNPFDFDEIKNKALEKISINLPQKYIVHVGRFAKVKRHDILIKAFSKIEDKQMNLILVGDGTERYNIEKLIKDLKLESRILLTGVLKNPFPIIKNAKLLVLSSENEGFGNVLVEALCLNTPVVSTATIGAKEILKEKLSIFLSKINDDNDLAKTIDKTIEYIYKNNNFNTELENYDKTNILKKYKNLMNCI